MSTYSIFHHTSLNGPCVYDHNMDKVWEIEVYHYSVGISSPNYPVPTTEANAVIANGREYQDFLEWCVLCGYHDGDLPARYPVPALADTRTVTCLDWFACANPKPIWDKVWRDDIGDWNFPWYCWSVMRSRF